MAELKLEDWFPMSPLIGPPLPVILGIYWPWLSVVQLKAGFNEYTYKGKERAGGSLLASIKDYLMVAYYLQEETNSWAQIMDDTLVKTGYLLNIKVSENCTWTF